MLMYSFNIFKILEAKKAVIFGEQVQWKSFCHNIYYFYSITLLKFCHAILLHYCIKTHILYQSKSLITVAAYNYSVKKSNVLTFILQMYQNKVPFSKKYPLCRMAEFRIKYWWITAFITLLFQLIKVGLIYYFINFICWVACEFPLWDH